MRERIKNDMKTAMKSGDKPRLGVLRLVAAAVQAWEIEAKREPKDADVLAVMTKMVKQRRDSIEQYTKGGRPELAAAEQAEIAVIESYLPKQMDEAAAKAAVGALVTELGAVGPKDMGKVMGALKERFAGQMDMAKASGWVKEALK
jgi:uncharacterized protein YqeY